MPITFERNHFQSGCNPGWSRIRGLFRPCTLEACSAPPKTSKMHRYFLSLQSSLSYMLAGVGTMPLLVVLYVHPWKFIILTYYRSVTILCELFFFDLMFLYRFSLFLYRFYTIFIIGGSNVFKFLFAIA